MRKMSNDEYLRKIKTRAETCWDIMKHDGHEQNSSKMYDYV